MVEPAEQLAMSMGSNSSVPAAITHAQSVRRALVVALLSLGPAAAQNTLTTIQDETSRAPVNSLCIPRDTRAEAHCDPSTTVFRAEKQQTFDLALPVPNTRYCAAAIGVEFTQRDSFVRVMSTIDNADCAASSGAYQLSVSVRNERLDVTKLDFTETWQRNDDKSVMFTRDYPIGTNVDVVSVHAHSLRCACMDAAQ
jgi:hypothetical protein